jgi:hypothetical protein
MQKRLAFFHIQDGLGKKNNLNKPSKKRHKPA